MIKQAARLAGSTIIGQFIALISLPIITRQFTQDGFSDLSTYIALSGIISTISTLRLETAISTTENNKVSALISSSAVTSFMLSVLLSFFVLVLIELGVINVNMNPLEFFVILLIGSITSALLQLILYFSLKMRDISSANMIKIHQPASTSAFQIAFSLFTTSGAGLIAGDALSRLYVCIISIRSSKLSIKTKLDSKEIINRIDFIKYTLPASILNVASSQILILFFSFLGKSKSLALYALALRIASIPVGLLSQSLGQSYISDIGSAESNLKKSAIFFRYMYFSFMLSSTICTAGILLIDPLFKLIFSAEWSESIKLSQILLAVGIIQIPAVTISQTLIILGMNNIQLYWDIIRFAAAVAWLSFATVARIDASIVIEIHSAVMAALYALLILIVLILVKKRRNDESINPIANL